MNDHFFGSDFHCLDDMLVSGAAAKVAIDRFADFRLRWLAVLFQEWDQRHQHAWGAVTALRSMRFPEGFLERMKVLDGAQPLDRANLMPDRLNGENQTGSDRFTIEQEMTSC